MNGWGWRERRDGRKGKGKGERMKEGRTDEIRRERSILAHFFSTSKL